MIIGAFITFDWRPFKLQSQLRLVIADLKQVEREKWRAHHDDFATSYLFCAILHHDATGRERMLDRQFRVIFIGAVVEERLENDSGISLSLGVSSAQEPFPFKIGGWSSESAESILRMTLGVKAGDRMMRLESKAAQTQLTDGEQAELDGYEGVSVFLEFLKRSARQHLAEPNRTENPLSRVTGVDASAGR